LTLCIFDPSGFKVYIILHQSQITLSYYDFEREEEVASLFSTVLAPLCCCLFRGLRAFSPGKYRRLQFVECANDINAMIDAAKFADLVLLLIDGSYGFEMVRLKRNFCCFAFH
jgi:hypothetical protein